MDRHLLPEEIDQLLDGDVGFGTAPLKMHVRACATCRAELDEARALVRQLEHLPHFVPSTVFADRVLSQVQVFVPWHVAALDTVRGWMPRTRTARAFAWTGVGSAAVVLTIVSLFLLTRLDAVIFSIDLAVGRVRAAVGSGLADVVAAFFGNAAVHAFRTSGAIGVWVALTLLLLFAAVTARAMRAVVAGPRRR
ncbi:MAG TPA: hypothetical protein VFW04_06940 [Gemmatimonadaceae bacterium]|nr:hypothetical protein [Gemmatimonadaceae bacterium]